MPLRITLKPFEALVINGTSIRNGKRPADLLIETQSRFLRESEILKEEDVETPADRIEFALQVLYMTDPRDRAEPQAEVLDLMRRFVEAAPSATLIVADICSALLADKHHTALKHARKLVDLEADLMDRAEAAAA